MRTGTGRTKYGHKREENTGHGEHRSDKGSISYMTCSDMQLHHGCLNFILDGNKFKVLHNLAFVLDVSDLSNTCTDLKLHAFQLEEERKLLSVSML